MKYSSAGQVANRFEAEELAGDVLKDLKEDLQDTVLANAGEGIFGKLLNSIIGKIIDASAAAANNAMVEELLDGATADEIARRNQLAQLQDEMLAEAPYAEVPEELADEVPDDLSPETLTESTESDQVKPGVKKPRSTKPRPEAKKDTQRQLTDSTTKQDTGAKTSQTTTDSNDTTVEEDEDVIPEETTVGTAPSPHTDQLDQRDKTSNIPADVQRAKDSRDTETAQPVKTTEGKRIPKFTNGVNPTKKADETPDENDAGAAKNRKQPEPEDSATTSTAVGDESTSEPTPAADQPPVEGGQQQAVQPDQDKQPEQEGENDEDDDEEGEGNQQQKQQQFKQRGAVTNLVNRLRFANDIKKIDNNIKLYDDVINDIDKKIKPLKNKQRPLKIIKRTLQLSKWSLRILQIVLYIIAAVLAVSIIFLFIIPLAPLVYYGAQALGAVILALDAQIKLLNEEIEKLEKDIKTEEEKKTALTKKTQQLLALRRRIVNQSLLESKNQQAGEVEDL